MSPRRVGDGLILAAMLLLGAGACTPSASAPASGEGGSGGHASGSAGSAAGSGTAGSSGGVSGMAGASTGKAGNGTSTGMGGAGSGGSGTGGASTGGSNSGGTGGIAGGAPDASAEGGVAGKGNDASADQAAPSDSGVPPGCIGMFCEDFESGKLDPKVWTIGTSGGQTVVVQKTTVAHGTYAAQFHALPNVLSYDLIITKNAPAGLRGHHFGRAYLYLTPKPPDQHMTLFWAGSAGFPTFKRLEVATYQKGWQLTSVNQTGINSGSAALSGTKEVYAMGGTTPVEQWICVEWEFNDTPDLVRVFVNGKQDVEFTNIVLSGASSGQVGGFADFGFGYYIWHPVTYPFDVFYDDIVLDTKRIGCLP